MADLEDEFDREIAVQAHARQTGPVIGGESAVDQIRAHLTEPPEISSRPEFATLWIECPHCEGAAGWYGCANCAAVLSRDDPPTRSLCARCQGYADCAANGGHAFGEVTHDHRGGFERSCACGATRRVWKAQWDGKRYVEVGR